MGTRPQPVWWHCWGCRSNIRSYTQPFDCPICGGWDICEFRLTSPAMGQGSMFEHGSVEGDLVHPDDAEGRLREQIAGLLRLRESLTPAVNPARAMPAKQHWFPFPSFLHDGRMVGRWDRM